MNGTRTLCLYETQWCIPLFLSLLLVCYVRNSGYAQESGNKMRWPRERISINEGWKFMRYKDEPDHLVYDERPIITNYRENQVADAKPTESNQSTAAATNILKNWILPSANDFIKDPTKHFKRPAGNPGSDFPFVQSNFNDESWETVDLPHDWAINGPFYKEANPEVGGGMGRLPVQGVAWYRKKLNIPSADAGKTIQLQIDGAMSYAMVWLNGNLVGGWPYGYNSFCLDLTPYIQPGGNNQLAIRLDNPNNSSRWYRGAGIYRNVWLIKTNSVHVAQWGTSVQLKRISNYSATLHLAVEIENKSNNAQKIEVRTDLYQQNNEAGTRGKKVIAIPSSTANIDAGSKNNFSFFFNFKNPLLWGPPPLQTPNLYVAVTTLYADGKAIDEYETTFGIRIVQFDPLNGLLVNGQRVRIQGVNQHHDLGALGAAFNLRAAERQLQMLAEMGCNAIRMAHNPPAPELLDLTDRMGFLVIDEIFDCWERGKTPLDFHLIFNDWHEADTRAFVRRDRNHPSIIAWSFGNEVGEQYTNDSGALIAKELHDIVKEEDSTRPATASMNYAKPNMPFPREMDILSLNYQGEGIRDAPAYAHLKGIRTSPLYPAFQKQFPNKLIVSSETASALSSRGTFLFPVYNGISAPVSDSTGGNSIKQEVSAYELYTAAFGASPDKVFVSQDKHPYVAGEFVWSGWDYLGEPTPYYTARSSYCGIIDLAGFKKDRFYLYQSRWIPDLPIAHILPHWTWPDRMGMITPVHVFSSANEAELFVNNKSQGRKRKTAYEYRFRWDSVVYEPGEVKVISYKNGKPWATSMMRTAGKPFALQMDADRTTIAADGKDLSFITVSVVDEKGTVVPVAANKITFQVSGPGDIVATDNGNPADMEPFHSKERNAFSGLALVIMRARPRTAGTITLTASADGLERAMITVKTRYVP